jgi:hypothetical protein
MSHLVINPPRLGRGRWSLPEPLARPDLAVMECFRDPPTGRVARARGNGLSGPAVQDAEGADVPWVLADAVVLATARLSGTRDRPAGLPDLIANGDAVFHLIPSAAEIEGALGRLLGAGLISVGEHGIAVEPLGRELVARARGTDHGDPMARMRSLLALLEHVPTDPVPWELDREVYEAVTLEYRHRVWETFRAGRRRGI